MKRPLAVFGCVFLLCLLAAAQLGLRPVWPWALAAAAAFFVVWLLRRGKAAGLWHSYLPVVLAALALAGFWQTAYDALVYRPVAGLAGETHGATFVVQDVNYNAGEVEFATVRVTALDGESVPAFKAGLWYPGEVAVGDVCEAELRFSLYEYGRPRGTFVSAYASGLAVTGRQVGFLEGMRLVQYRLSENIREKLPARLAGISAAMAVGDRRYMPDEAVVGYRKSGLSHMQVVSGLHLAILCGLVGLLVGRLVKNRRAASLVCMGFVLLFMALAGFTPSIVRSGVMFLLVFAAGLFRRQADIYTSLGLAALLLCLQNPYAAGDLGLLLSFSAVLGVLVGSMAASWLQRRFWPGRPKLAGRCLLYLMRAAVCAFFITLATLPALTLFYGGVSLMTVPMNMVALPLLPFIVVSGLVMAIPAGVPVLGLLARLAALLNGALLALLERLTNWCAGLPGVYQPVGGLYGFAVVALAFLLVYLGWRSRRVAYLVFTAAVFLPAALLVQNLFSAEVATFTLAGNGNPSLVVEYGGQAVVLYRGTRTDKALENAFVNGGLESCALVVDMRQNATGSGYERLKPREVVRVNGLMTGEVLRPFEGVEIWLKAQGEGYVACVEVDGTRVAVTSGAVDLTPYPGVDVLVAGSGKVRPGAYRQLLSTGAAPEWAGDETTVYFAQSGAQVLVRRGVGYSFREVSVGVGEFG